MTVCFPPAFSVPGLTQGPQWWDKAGVPRPYSNELYDPRWRGATRRGYTNGAGEAAVFRGLHLVESGSPVLYMSLQMFSDPKEGANSDGVYVGFQAASGDSYVISISAYDHVGKIEAEQPGGILSTKISGGAQTTLTNPKWLNDAKAWLTVNPPAGPVAQTLNWAVNLRVPTKRTAIEASEFDDVGIDLGDLVSGGTFRFWYAIVKDLGSAAVPYYLPRTGAEITIDPVTLQNVFPAAGSWDEARVGSGAGCGTGISLDPYDIGTSNLDPTTGLPAPHEILVSATSPPPPPINKIHAKPLNGTGGNVTPHSLNATFRTANWGSAANFEFATSATPWEEVLPGVNKDNGDGSTANGLKASIDFDWQIPTSDAPAWLPGGTKWKHQCMLVTLSGPYDFINDSAYRNMDFVKASEFERLADLSVKGLGTPPDGGTHHEVYLHVDRSNMPFELQEPQRPVDLREALREIDARDQGGDSSPPDSSPPEEEVVQTTFDALAEIVPTIRYRVFHTTPNKINVNGTVKPVLREQTAFGYFVLHPDDVWGWDQTLGGDFKPEQVPGLFKVAIPADGKLVIKTKVKGWEERPPAERGGEVEPGPKQPPGGGTPGGGCLPDAAKGGALLAALVALIRKLLRR